MKAESYYELTFSLIQYHKYSLTEIENMMPWERDIYVNLLRNYLEAASCNGHGHLRAKGLISRFH